MSSVGIDQFVRELTQAPCWRSRDRRSPSSRARYMALTAPFKTAEIRTDEWTLV
jgi:hypothetical protein